MNDVQHKLQEMFRRRETDVLTPTVAPPPAVRRRVRARQIANVAVATLAVGALVGGSILGLDRLASRPDDRAPGAPLPTAPDGWRAAALPHVSLAYPQNWYVMALDPSVDGYVMQLSNFDPGIDPRGLTHRWCEGRPLPANGALLEVMLTLDPSDDPPWPTTLDPMQANGRPCDAGTVLGANWATPAGVAYAARAYLGDDVRAVDDEAVRSAFDSMTFPATAQPQTSEPLEYPALYVDTADSPLGALALYVYVSERPWLGVLGPPWFHGGAGDIGGHVPEGDEDVTMALNDLGGVVWGMVSHAAVRAELFTVEGKTFPAELVALPDSVGRLGVQAVWGAIEGKTRDRVTTLLYDEDGNVLNPTYPIGPDVTIAQGTHPEGGPWRLFITTSNDGPGLSFAFEEHGAGGGCCMSPLGDKDLFQLGWSSSSDRSIPRDIEGLASTKVARVEYVHADGRVFEGALYPIPDRFIGPANALLIFVPGEVGIDGRVVAYDSSGAVLATQHTGPPGEPPGPTPEIDAVWTALRAARDAVSRYLREAGTLVGMTPEDMTALVPDVTFNASDSAVPNEVSLRGATEREIVLVSTTEGGDVYCIAVEATEGGGNYRYGRQDAATLVECRGGWE
jgi:hypothetical protein